MNKNRILRYALVGLAFILSTGFHFWVFGGKLRFILQLFPAFGLGMVTAVFVALLTMPFIGFIMAPVGSGILHVFFGHGIYFKYPREEKSIESYFTILRAKLNSPVMQAELDDLKGKFLERFAKGKKGSAFAFRAQAEKLYGYFIYFMRTCCHENIERYVIRQFVNFWTHINVLISVISGFIIGLLCKLYYVRKPGLVMGFGRHRSFILYELPFLLLYLVFVFLQLRRSSADARDIEYKWLMNQ